MNSEVPLIIVGFILTSIYIVGAACISLSVFNDNIILYSISIIVWLWLFNIIVDFIFKIIEIRRLKNSTRT